MARPQHIDNRFGLSRDDSSQDWQALRGELLDLLDEVEGHVERDARQPLQSQPQRQPNDQTGRHRAALNAVAQTMERFKGRDGDTDITGAIEDIRSHHNAPQRMQRAEAAASQIREMSAQLEAARANLGSTRPNGDRSDSNQQISAQIAELARTVELLAGAVGESGQVRRIESQISGLAHLIEDHKTPDQSEVAQRLDRLASSVDHLLDVQHQTADRPVALLEELGDSQDRGFGAIESGIRSIYDRIDAMEESFALHPEDFQRLSADIGRVAEMLYSEEQPGSLIARVDALNARMNLVENGDGSASLGDLRADVELLREAVRDAVEPRFSELHGKIDRLDEQLKKSNAVSGESLENQMRMLASRLDQTGDKLSALDSASGGSQSLGDQDISELADMVASRTSEAVVRSQGSGPGRQIKNSLDQVDARLARLEEVLRGGVSSTPSVSPAPAPEPKAEPALSAITHVEASAPQAPLLREDRPAVRQQFGSRSTSRDPAPAEDPDDRMSANPSDDSPLIDKGFAPSPGPSRSQPEEIPAAPAEISMPEPAAEAAPVAAPKRANIPPLESALPSGFDPSRVEIPRKPRSSFAEEKAPAFSSDISPADEFDRTDRASASHSTFIEAARKAAMRGNTEEPEQEPSLVKRLLAKVQIGARKPSGEEEDAPSAVDAHEAARPADVRQWQERSASPSPKMGDEHHQSSGLLAMVKHYRRPLILAGLLIVVSLLALNLLERRLGSTQPPAPPQQSAPAAPAQSGDSQPMLDPTPTGSIDPFVRDISGMSMANAQAVQQPELTTGSFSGPLQRELTPSAARPAQPSVAQEKKLELPPEALGPLELREAAANGDPRAQFEVAAIYGEGQAVDKDLATAAEWYGHAASQGFAPAEYRLGNLYEHGQGVPKDIGKARFWYERAAQSGNRMSMHNLAALYASGAMGDQQFSKAAEWFEKAAGLGLTDSQFNLGMLYARGLGVKQDLPTSYKWFSLAALRGDEGAASARDDVARSLDSETVGRLKAEVSAWRPLAIDMSSNFAPIGTWSEDFNPGQAISEKQVVQAVQQALNRLGFDVGTPDGLMGPRTREAIAQFERETGMSESGAINPRLLAVLGSQPV